MRVFVCIACALVVAATGSVWAQGVTEELPPPKDLELVIGSTTYDAADGETITVKTPDGKTMKVMVRRKAYLNYDGHGIAFNYPAAMEISVETDDDISTVHLDNGNGVFCMLQIYPRKVPAQELKSLLAESVKQQLAEQGSSAMKRTEGAVSRTFLGVSQTGDLLEGRMNSATDADPVLRIEFYAFQIGEMTIAATLQYFLSVEDEAQAAYDAVSTSLRGTN